MFFDGWAGIWRTVIIGISAYVVLVFFVRVSGKRTLSKMNAFDLVVTVAIGSTLATILLSPEVALAEGVTALALLVFLQFVITWLSVRSQTVSRLVKSSPRLLYHSGRFIDSALKAERVTREEVLQALRSQGTGSLEEAAAVVLETDGTFSVLQNAGEKDLTALKDVNRG
jgi:uncharacterized membrane protein YcaP (DUF421 family)